MAQHHCFAQFIQLRRSRIDLMRERVTELNCRIQQSECDLIHRQYPHRGAGSGSNQTLQGADGAEMANLAQECFFHIFEHDHAPPVQEKALEFGRIATQQASQI